MESDRPEKGWMDYVKIASKVLSDKCWYSIWNLDLFANVDRVYSSEGYYDSYYYLLMMDANKVTDQIYLGSAFNAADLEWLKEKKIDAIVNVTPSINNYYPDDFEYFNFGATDLNGSSLEGFYQKFYRIVKENPNKRFLVHCYAGKSRSAALLLYYLMKEYDWPMKRGLRHLKNCRPCININNTFITEILALFPSLDDSESEESME